MRVALFGGTFDPPHRGHVAIARAAAETFALDTVLFTPAGRQPLKLDSPPAPFVDRLAMVTAACAADGRFAVSNLDAPRADFAPNYTVDTLALLRDLMPGAELFALVGADAFLGLRQWREPDRLLAMAEWIVATRPGTPIETESDLEGLELSPQQRARVSLLQVREEVSATALRQRLACGDPCPDMLPGGVAEYIREHGLYGFGRGLAPVPL